ncbi:MAG: hypothetical protein AB1813_10990 [Verrucomicrobiota bacterium]
MPAIRPRCILGWAAASGALLLCIGFFYVAFPSSQAWIASALLAMAFAGMTGTGPEKRVAADFEHDMEGNRKGFALRLGPESISLLPGKTWVQLDRYKWVTRGLIEGPQSFQVSADGTVAINSDRIHPNEPDALQRLENEINKRHTVVAPPKPAVPAARSAVSGAKARPDKAQFKVKVDHLGHLMIECWRGEERMETGLRGLPSWVTSGVLLPPKQVHVDPLQRYVEIDGARFEINAEGAHQLEELLNAKYAPSLQNDHDIAIEIKESSVSATGFDIHFTTIRAGARFEVKGHLCQEYLDILQDPVRCELLQPGIMIRLAPPYLLVRRKRPDGGEEKIPEFPDIQYRRVTAAQLQQIFNHPCIRRSATGDAHKTHTIDEPLTNLATVRIARDLKNKQALWLHCEFADGSEPVTKALTHHNIAEMQQNGCFQPQFDVALSFDNRELSILNAETKVEEKFTLSDTSGDGELAKISEVLTAALRPPDEASKISSVEKTAAPRNEIEKPVSNAKSVSEILNASSSGPASDSSSRTELKSTPPKPATNSTMQRAESSIPPKASETVQDSPPALPLSSSSAPVVAEPKQTAAEPAKQELPEDSAVSADAPPGFVETDEVRIAKELFPRLSARLGIAIQEGYFSLYRVFEDRLFEIINLNRHEIDNLFDLRGAEFRGFYITHINEQKVHFVYAARGAHIEWSPQRCVLQPAAGAEPVEFKGQALRGLALDQNQGFVFIVTPEFKIWIKRYEKNCADAGVHFVSVREFPSARASLELVWPELA